jgi:hypothetical protein
MSIGQCKNPVEDELRDDAARLIRQHRLDGCPLMVGELVAHDSRLRFGATPSTRNGPSR